MEAKELLELRKLPVGAQIGVLVGGLLHHWIDKNFWHIERQEACAAGGLVGALLWKFVNMVLVDPFIVPLIRKRELTLRLSECATQHAKRAHLLTVDQWREIVQKIIVDYLLPRKKAAKEE